MTSTHVRTVVMVLAALVWTSGLAVAAPGAAGDDPGPPDGLPDPVPDFVGDVLGAIGDFLGDPVGSLGDVVSGLTPAGDAASTPTEG